MPDNTPPKYPKGTPRKHHFVPRGYLAGFCRDGTDRFALYDRAREAYRDRQRPADVAHIKDFYAFEAEDGELRFDVEHALGDMESTALPIIGKIDNGLALTGDERHALALYAAFQHIRTPVFQNTVDSIGEHIIRRVAMMAYGDGQEAAATMSQVPGAGQGISAAQMAEVAQQLEIEVHRRASLHIMLKMAPDIANTMYEMDWTIARRPDDKTSFITTDSPFCLVPGPDHVPQPFRGIGLKTPGILKVLPLSQASALIMSEPGEAMFSRTLTRDQVRQTNHAIAMQCQNFVFARDLQLVERIVKTTGIDKVKWQSPVASNHQVEQHHSARRQRPLA